MGILLVEDTTSDELLVKRALVATGMNIEVKVIRDGASALAYVDTLERHEAQLPHVVFLDLKLPKVNGLDVLRKIRATPRTRHLPVVVLTSSDEDEDVLYSYSLGANAYVKKPVSVTQLSQLVDTTARFWIGLNTAPR